MRDIEASSFLKSLLASHGPNYLETLFGPKARNHLQDMGGVDKVAIALSESQTIEDFDEDEGHSSMVWAALLRMLDRRDSSYRE